MASPLESCPDEGQLAAFVDDTLDGAARAVVESHLDSCPGCRATIGHVAATSDGPRQLGRYRLDRVIGSGGMGVVWQAWDPALERGLAIKVLRPELTDDHGRARLIREARALARLQHPNVVAVHDVGEHDRDVFIATELIEGETMDRWQRDRPAAEVIAAYAQAARGLAAAHRLGLVHRDVKPSNILVGRDGRVRIGDFGLAIRDVATATTAPRGSAIGREPQLTGDGEIVGTPAYMAPEQRGGSVVDARADQYSLCLALVEALRGVRPEPGASAETLASSGSTRPAPETRDRAASVPWPAIARGLAARPDDRWPELGPLIAALEGKAGGSRRTLLAIGGGVVAVGAVLVATLALRGGDRDPAAACVDRRPLAGVWDPATREAVVSAVRARKLPYGEDVTRATLTAIDAFTADLEVEDRRACEDDAARRQSAEVVAKRRACLARVEGQLSALVELLVTRPDDRTIQRAPSSARGLPEPAMCNTPAGLADQAIAPDPATAARVHAVSAQVTKAIALRLAFRLPEARALAETALADARATGFLPAIAEAQHELGSILHYQGDPAAEQTLIDALAVAAQAHADYRSARIAVLLVDVVGAKGDVAAAERQARLARPAIIRAGNDRHLEAVVETGLGRANLAATKYAEALAHHKRAEELHALLGMSDYVDFDRRSQATALANLDRIDEATRINQQLLASNQIQLGAKHPRTIADLRSWGLLLYRAGRYAEAVPVLERTVALTDEVSGRRTDQAASVRSALAITYLALGRAEEAEVLLREAVEVFAAHMPPEHVELRGQRANLALVRIKLGRYGEAEAALAELADAARKAKDDESLGEVLQNLAECLIHTGKPAQALVAAREALERYGKLFGLVSRRVAEARTTLGNVQVALRKPEAAATEYAASIEALERTVSKDTAQLGEPLIGLGELRLARADAAGARPLLERAVAVLAKADPVELARGRFALARALDALGDRGAARAEARAAAELDRAAGARATARLAEVSSWLDGHR